MVKILIFFKDAISNCKRKKKREFSLKKNELKLKNLVGNSSAREEKLLPARSWGLQNEENPRFWGLWIIWGKVSLISEVFKGVTERGCEGVFLEKFLIYCVLFMKTNNSCTFLLF